MIYFLNRWVSIPPSATPSIQTPERLEGHSLAQPRNGGDDDAAGGCTRAAAAPRAS